MLLYFLTQLLGGSGRPFKLALLRYRQSLRTLQLNLSSHRTFQQGHRTGRRARPLLLWRTNLVHQSQNLPLRKLQHFLAEIYAPLRTGDDDPSSRMAPRPLTA